MCARTRARCNEYLRGGHSSCVINMESSTHTHTYIYIMYMYTSVCIYIQGARPCAHAPARAVPNTPRGGTLVAL